MTDSNETFIDCGFMTVQSSGHPDPKLRNSKVVMEFKGEGALEKAQLLHKYLIGQVQNKNTSNKLSMLKMFEDAKIALKAFFDVYLWFEHACELDRDMRLDLLRASGPGASACYNLKIEDLHKAYQVYNRLIHLSYQMRSSLGLDEIL